MLTASCNYSAVLAGAKKLQMKVKLGTKAAFTNLVISGTDETINNLLKSYKTTPGRSDFARTGILERAIFTAINTGTAIPGGWLAGIGDMKQLYSMAPYWNMVEEGSSEYVGEEREGFWADSSGSPYSIHGAFGRSGAPDSSYYPQHKWVDAPGFIMEITKPIQEHKFYANTADGMRKIFLSYVSGFVKGAI